MRLIRGSAHDPILADIERAIKDGYFDRRKELGPSELETTPVEVLMDRVAMMSGPTRRACLATIGRFPRGPVTLSGESPRPAGRRRSLAAIMGPPANQTPEQDQ